MASSPTVSLERRYLPAQTRDGAVAEHAQAPVRIRQARQDQVAAAAATYASGAREVHGEGKARQICGCVAHTATHLGGAGSRSICGAVQDLIEVDVLPRRR